MHIVHHLCLNCEHSNHNFSFYLFNLLFLEVNLFIYSGFTSLSTLYRSYRPYRRAVVRAEETSTYSSSGFCTVNCRPRASNYQLSHLRPCPEPNPGLTEVGGERVTTLLPWPHSRRSNHNSFSLPNLSSTNTWN